MKRHSLTGEITNREFTLVLGGGGMRGLAHVGVLQALEEEGLIPAEIVGSSVGALIAATWCSGMPVHDMREVAIALRRRDVFRVAHRDMALKRMMSPALYRREPLEELCRGLLGELTFDQLEHPLIVNTVDINAGTQVFWGTHGLTDVRVADAVYASCALPGYLPPCEINGRFFVDGAVLANLPVGIASLRGRDLVIAVDVGANSIRLGTENTGFAAIIARAQELAIRALRNAKLVQWRSPPLVLMQPPVDHISLFSFKHNEELIERGYRHARMAASVPLPAPGAEGVYPRRRVRVTVDRERCVGCGACLIQAPMGTFAIDPQGKAVVLHPEQEWSPADGDYLQQCPTRAIGVTYLESLEDQARAI